MPDCATPWCRALQAMLRHGPVTLMLDVDKYHVNWENSKALRPEHRHSHGIGFTIDEALAEALDTSRQN